MLSLLIAAMPRHQALNNAAENVKFEILGSELDIVTETRYLGVQVDTWLVQALNSLKVLEFEMLFQGHLKLLESETFSLKVDHTP